MSKNKKACRERERERVRVRARARVWIISLTKNIFFCQQNLCFSANYVRRCTLDRFKRDLFHLIIKFVFLFYFSLRYNKCFSLSRFCHDNFHKILGPVLCKWRSMRFDHTYPFYYRVFGWKNRLRLVCDTCDQQYARLLLHFMAAAIGCSSDKWKLCFWLSLERFTMLSSYLWPDEFP